MTLRRVRAPGTHPGTIDVRCIDIRRVGELSEGGVNLGPGTMYGALDRLVEQELVVLDREELQAGRLRRYYRLTPQGRKELAAEVRRLEQDIRVGQTALGGAS